MTAVDGARATHQGVSGKHSGVAEFIADGVDGAVEFLLLFALDVVVEQGVSHIALIDEIVIADADVSDGATFVQGM